METKYVRIPFDVKLAKEITNGEVDGKVVTRDGRSVRIICWDGKWLNKYPICALTLKDNGDEYFDRFTQKGFLYDVGEDESDLMLEVPEPVTFKDGDIVSLRNGDISIVKGEPFKNLSGNLTLSKTYIRLSGNTLGSLLPIILNDAKEATEDEINELKYKMQDYNDSYVKSLCKRFFGIEEKPCEFKPKDWVLCKGNEWSLCRFSHTSLRGGNKLLYIAVGGIAYEDCLPYNEQTAHLLGTTENYK